MNGWVTLASAITTPPPAVTSRPRRSEPSVVSGVPFTRDRDVTLQDGRLVPVTSAGTDAPPSKAIGLPAVYAAVRLITHTIDQLPLRAHTGDGPGAPLPDWLRNPARYGCDYTLPDLIEYLVTSQATRGAAYLYCTPVGEQSWRVDPINPDDVSVQISTGGPVRRRTYRLDGGDVDPVQVYPWQRRQAGILPMPFLIVPGQAAGVGPLQAARQSLGGYLDTDQYAANMMASGRTYSGGYLHTEQDIDEVTAQHYQGKMIERNADPLAGPLVLGSGLTWQSTLPDPKTAQWIEARQFNAQEVCRMFGIPPRYLGLPSGDSTTYATARDNDAQLLRTCVSGYTNTIAHGLSRLLPPGRNPTEDQAVRFDFDAWLGTPAAAPPAALDPGQEVPQ